MGAKVRDPEESRCCGRADVSWFFSCSPHDQMWLPQLQASLVCSRQGEKGKRIGLSNPFYHAFVSRKIQEHLG